MQQLTNQLNAVLFPVVVDSDAVARADRLRRIFLHGTRLSLAMVLPIGVTLVALADPLIHAWVGSRVSEMQGSVPVLQILSMAVIIRVGAGTATTLLKGGGMHRLMASVSMATGIVNLVVSVALVRPLGLIGVALGTLVPVVCSTCFFVYPAACRRVELPLRTLAAQAIWPALWPALTLGAVYFAMPPDRVPERSPWSRCSRWLAVCSIWRSLASWRLAAAIARCTQRSRHTCGIGRVSHQRRPERPEPTS